MKFRFGLALLGCAALLAFGVFPQEDSYYEALRPLVFLVAGFAALFEWSRKETPTGWIYGFAWIVMFWNPIIPVPLSKGVWIVVDLGAAAIMFGYWKKVFWKNRYDT